VRRIANGEVVIDPQVVGRLLRRRRDQEPLEALTDEEQSVLELMAEGGSDRAIGERLELPLEMVEERVANIFAKLGLQAAGEHARVQAVLTYLGA
jgi:DNA-binding NarL/FixJ family response regulator